MKCPGLNPESYAQYVLGTAPEEERAQIENHLMLGCQTCISEIRAYETLWHQVALQTPLSKPPAGLRKRIMSEVEGQAAGRPKRKWAWLPWDGLRPVPVAAELIAAVLAVSIGYFAGSRGRTVMVARNTVSVVQAPRPVTPAPTIPAAPALVPAVPSKVQNSTIDKELTELRAQLDQARVDNAQLQAQYQAQLQKSVPPPAPAPAQNAAASSPNLPAADQVAAQRVAEIEQLRERLAAATARISALERQALQYQTLIDIERRRADQSTIIASFATNPSLRVIPIKGTEFAPGAEGRVLIAGDQMLMVTAHLPALPQNRTYQLWLVRSKSPAIASAGTFNSDGSSNATLRFGNRELLTQVTAVAITDEPAGGSPQPTGHKWVIGVNSGL